MNKANLTGYWTTTAILAFAWLTGGAADLMQRPETVEGVVRLGYPVYFVTILGFWKVLGAVALLAPGFPRLKEWAYAGTVFETERWDRWTSTTGWRSDSKPIGATSGRWPIGCSAR